MATGFKSSSGRAPPGAPRLRFKIGDRVECNTAEGWLSGVVNQTWYREEVRGAARRHARVTGSLTRDP